jgi:hypothetical protein
MAGSGSEKQDSRACFSFGDPQNKISAKLDAKKNIDCRRTRLQIDCDLFGLEGYQGHIKVLHFSHSGRGSANKPQKNSPEFFRGYESLAGFNLAADCPLHSAGVRAEFVVQAVAVVQRCLLHSHGLSVAALSQPVSFLHGLFASSPSIVPA